MAVFVPDDLVSVVCVDVWVVDVVTVLAVFVVVVFVDVTLPLLGATVPKQGDVPSPHCLAEALA